MEPQQLQTPHALADPGGNTDGEVVACNTYQVIQVPFHRMLAFRHSRRMEPYPSRAPAFPTRG